MLELSAELGKRSPVLCVRLPTSPHETSGNGVKIPRCFFRLQKKTPWEKKYLSKSLRENALQYHLKWKNVIKKKHINCFGCITCHFCVFFLRESCGRPVLCFVECFTTPKKCALLNVVFFWWENWLELKGHRCIQSYQTFQFAYVNYESFGKMVQISMLTSSGMWICRTSCSRPGAMVWESARWRGRLETLGRNRIQLPKNRRI